MTKLTDIEGIGAAFASKLTEIGCTTQEKLLNLGASSSGRKKLAEAADISEKMILKWVNRADLARIKGVGEELADLLEHAGVDTVPELAQRNAENLFNKLKEVNELKNLVRKLPGMSQVEDWIEQAKKLPRAINY